MFAEEISNTVNMGTLLKTKEASPYSIFENIYNYKYDFTIQFCYWMIFYHQKMDVTGAN